MVSFFVKFELHIVLTSLIENDILPFVNACKEQKPACGAASAAEAEATVSPTGGGSAVPMRRHFSSQGRVAQIKKEQNNAG